MRHYYFRLIMGFVFLACLIFSAVTMNVSGVVLFIFMSAAMFYGAYTAWEVGRRRSVMSALEIQGLSAWYAPEHPVLKDCTFSLGEHEVVGLIGLNGAGKTTLLNVLSGLHAEFSIARAAFDGAAVQFRDPAFKRARYTVFAEDAAFGYFSFREYLAFAARAYAQPLPDVDALVRGFHFTDYAETPIRDLSTGNRKESLSHHRICPASAAAPAGRAGERAGFPEHRISLYVYEQLSQPGHAALFVACARKHHPYR